jgi:hypothetical protein
VTDRRAGLARALGGRQARQRRHRRFLVGAIVLLLVAGALLAFGGGDDDGFAEAATPICDEFETRLRSEFDLSFPDSVPTPEAQAEYLSHAFADTTQELVTALAALEPDGADARAGIEAMQALVDQLRDDPAVGVGTNPFTATVAAHFDAADVPACGSRFLAE